MTSDDIVVMPRNDYFVLRVSVPGKDGPLEWHFNRRDDADSARAIALIMFKYGKNSK